MRLMVSGLSRQWADRHPELLDSLGFLVRPRGSDSVPAVLDVTSCWCADNDCFGGFDRPAYERMLARWTGVQPGPLWVNAPDIVADAAATRALFDQWEPVLHGLGFPVSLVLQDGQESVSVPWERLEAVFVGGTTEFKLSALAFRLCREATSKGKRVHCGRVNTRGRMELAARMGAHTIDGSGFSRWRKRIAPGVHWMRLACEMSIKRPLLFDPDFALEGV